MVRIALFFAMFGVSQALATRKPASLDDLQDIAQLSSQIAKQYLEEAQSRPTVEDALRSQREADAKHLGALHKAWYSELEAGMGQPCVNCGQKPAVALLATPTATVHLPEPDDSLSREMLLTDDALGETLSMLERAQSRAEAMLETML